MDAASLTRLASDTAETLKTKLTVVGGSPLDESKPNLPTVKKEVLKNPTAEVTKSLKRHLKEREGLKHFYKTLEPSPEHVETATNMVQKLLAKGVKVEKALNLTWLVLYDLAMLLDDSISMGFEENAKNVEVLKDTVKTVAGIFGFSRSDPKEGIKNVRFFNSKTFATDLKPGKVNGLFSGLDFHGETMIGTSLNAKILKKYDIEKATKPLIVIIITDGEIEGERPDFLKRVILSRAQQLRDFTKDKFGAHAISYQFAALGGDEGANDLINELDNDKTLGDYIDCMEQKSLEELTNKENTETKWVAATKLLLGSISEYYDERKLNAEATVEPSDENDLPTAGHFSEEEDTQDKEYKGGEDDGDDDDW